ncbi:hypothetical protein FA13DRAFT_1794073 [Coprinellus micaceus]|uniref:Secreted protein n=1 Tax=Coprinellus micaceus TaxID=71717 RepID=A0A4Y7T2G2_COPMI|nr:hypothetical protein FA13DRAFT_1794073 [Coprinellus micaceus]
MPSTKGGFVVSFLRLGGTLALSSNLAPSPQLHPLRYSSFTQPPPYIWVKLPFPYHVSSPPSVMASSVRHAIGTKFTPLAHLNTERIHLGQPEPSHLVSLLCNPTYSKGHSATSACSPS